MECEGGPAGRTAYQETDPDRHDRSLILLCLRLTPRERLERLAQAHEFRAVIRKARPFELRER